MGLKLPVVYILGIFLLSSVTSGQLFPRNDRRTELAGLMVDIPVTEQGYNILFVLHEYEGDIIQRESVCSTAWANIKRGREVNRSRSGP